MSSPTGAGYGFVGSVFGETDIVSPYLAMLPKETQQPAELKIPTQSFALSGSAELASLMASSSVQSHGRVFGDPNYIAARAKGSVAPEQYDDFMRTLNADEQFKKESQAVVELTDKNIQQLSQAQKIVSEDRGDFNNPVNRKYVQSLEVNNAFLANVLRGQESEASTINSRYAIFSSIGDIERAVQSLGITDDNEILAYVDRLEEQGALRYDKSSNQFIIDPRSESFIYDERNILTVQDFAKISQKLDLPTETVSDGRMEDGVYYNKERSKKILPKNLGLLVSEVTFQNYSRYGIANDGSINIKDVDSVELSQVALSYALDRKLIEEGDVVDGSYVQGDKAKEIYDAFYDLTASRQGFEKHESKMPRGGFGPGSRRGTEATSLLDEFGNPIPVIPATEIATRGGQIGVGNVVVRNGATPKARDIGISIPTTNKTMQLRHIVVAENGDIYMKGALSSEQMDIFTSQKEKFQKLYLEGILSSTSSTETNYIPVKGAMISEIATGLEITHYDNNPAVAIRKWAAENDKLRADIAQELSGTQELFD
jgi:hypothetical protein